MKKLSHSLYLLNKDLRYLNNIFKNKIPEWLYKGRMDVYYRTKNNDPNKLGDIWKQ